MNVLSKGLVVLALTAVAGCAQNRPLTRDPSQSDLDRMAAEYNANIENPEDQNFLASLLFAPAQFDDPVKIANEGIRRMVRNFCAPRIRKIELEIAAKERNVDSDLLSSRQLLTELRHLRTNPPSIHVPA